MHKTYKGLVQHSNKYLFCVRCRLAFVRLAAQRGTSFALDYFIVFINIVVFVSKEDQQQTIFVSLLELISGQFIKKYSVHKCRPEGKQNRFCRRLRGLIIRIVLKIT